jgi:hypothetical protein
MFYLTKQSLNLLHEALWLGIKLPTSASLLFLLTGKTKIKNEFQLNDFIIWSVGRTNAILLSYTMLPMHVLLMCREARDADAAGNTVHMVP